MDRHTEWTKPDGSGHEPTGKGVHADTDRERLYAAVSETIGTGLSERERRRGYGPKSPRPVTSGQIIAAAIGSVSAVLIFLGLLPFIYAAIIPPPFVYLNLPFQVCSSKSTDVCEQLGADESFHPGDPVPILVTRCSQEVYSQISVLPYLVNRNIVNDRTGTRIVLDNLASSAPAQGCQTEVTLANTLPPTVPPGIYYFEGVATVYGRFRTTAAYFRTEPFSVAKLDQRLAVDSCQILANRSLADCAPQALAGTVD